MNEAFEEHIMQALTLHSSDQHEQTASKFDECIEQYAKDDNDLAYFERHIGIKISSLKQLGLQDEVNEIIKYLNEKYAVSDSVITHERTLKASDNFEMAKLYIPEMLFLLECYEEILALNWSHWALLAKQYHVAQLMGDPLMGLKIQTEFNKLYIRGRDDILMLKLHGVEHSFWLNDVQRFEISNLLNDNAYVNFELSKADLEISGSIPFPYNDGICAEGQITIKQPDTSDSIEINCYNLKRNIQWSPYGFEIALQSEKLGDVTVLIWDIHKYAHRDRVVTFEE